MQFSNILNETAYVSNIQVFNYNLYCPTPLIYYSINCSNPIGNKLIPTYISKVFVIL